MIVEFEPYDRPKPPNTEVRRIRTQSENHLIRRRNDLCSSETNPEQQKLSEEFSPSTNVKRGGEFRLMWDNTFHCLISKLGGGADAAQVYWSFLEDTSVISMHFIFQHMFGWQLCSRTKQFTICNYHWRRSVCIHICMYCIYSTST